MKNEEKDTIWAIEPLDSHTNNCIRLWKEEFSKQEDWVADEDTAYGFWTFKNYDLIKKVIDSALDKGLKFKVYFRHKKKDKDYTKLKHWTLHKFKKTVAVKKTSEV